MSNLSQEKRQRMLEFLNTLKEKNKDDENYIQAIAEIETELNSKKYGLVWEKHIEEVDIQMQDNIPVFTEVKTKEIKANKDEKYNFLLEGDNLHSLKLLQKTHKNKIDVIYIDPPYNTKNKEFIYNDKMIGEDDGYRHSKWLSFMSERLEIAKDLLTDDGVIFISIDEHEFAQLKLLCDNIFGEQNFVENFIWIKNSTKNLSKTTSTNHEYIITYAKNIEVVKELQLFRKRKEGYDEVLELVEEAKKEGLTPSETQKRLRQLFKDNLEYKGISMYNNIDNKWNVFRISDSSAPKATGKGGVYDVIHPITGKVCKLPKRGWAYTEETMNNHIENGLIYFGKDETTVPQFKRLLTTVKTEVRKSVIRDFTDGKKELQKIFGEAPFDNAKPTTLIKDLISTLSDDATVLDFFAGSGTTGHAVMELNKEDGGNRTYIMCTNNENKIAEEITYKRMVNIQKDFPHNLKYFKTNFIAKDSEELSSEMLESIVELVELEHGVSIDNNEYVVVLSDKDAKKLVNDISNYPNLKGIYLSKYVLLNKEMKDILESYDIHIIPDYYFEYELIERGELW